MIRRLDGLLQGNYRTVFRGFGLELAELREYQWNDDVRAIDWYVTARMQTPYIRLRVEDRDLTAWFLLDLSPSMDFGTARTSKRDLLVDCVGVLARLLTRHGNRVGALIYNGNAIRVIPAETGRMQVLRLIADLLSEPRLARAPMTRLSALLEAAGVPADTPFIGTEDGQEFFRVLILGEKQDMDVGRAAADILEAGRRLVARHPDIGAIVLECTNMPPYAHALRDVLVLPVYDIYSLITWLHAGLRPRDFGPPADRATCLGDLSAAPAPAR